MRVVFGEFTVDPEARELLQAGRRVELSPKALDLLLALVEARPRALTRSQLDRRLWPDKVVSGANLRLLVMEIRERLGDDPHDPHWIRTVHRYGYAFNGTAREESPHGQPLRPSPFSLLRNERELLLYEGENLIGRDAGATVRLASDTASRRHARIVVEATSARLEDLGSKNGTKLNGEPLREPAALQPGDRIEVAHETLFFLRRSPDTTRSETGGSEASP